MQRKAGTSVARDMEYVFHPSSVAVIGASRDSEREKNWGWVGRLVKFGFTGRVYPVNPGASEIMGFKAYPSVTAVPGPVDYAIIAVPREMVPGQVSDCVQKGVRVAHIYTAGFSETGTEAGARLQSEVVAAMLAGGTRLIGPNCMGVYCPGGGLTFDVRFPRESGPIAFISQSGVGGRHLIHMAAEKGLRFSHAVSYGNALDIDCTELFEYAVSDMQTRFVLLYLEGLRDGRKLASLLRQHSRSKPVVIIKGGMSEGGAGAAASHTASLAGNRSVWEALFKQAGLVHVDTFEEAVEQLIALQDLPPVRGRNVGLVGRGGGMGVLSSDICEREGLRVPRFSDATRGRLRAMTEADAGLAISNPVEIGLGAGGISPKYGDAIRAVAEDPGIDSIISFLNPEDYLHYGVTGWVEGISEAVIAVGRALPKPFAAVVLPGLDAHVFEGTRRVQQTCQAAGVACFHSLDSAARAISKLAAYYRHRSWPG